MTIMGPNGKPIDVSKALNINAGDLNNYKIGEIAISTHETPETVLSKALEQVKGLLQQQGQFGAADGANPFQFEPGALAVFMMLSNEVERLNGEIEQLKKGKNNDGDETDDGASVRDL